MPKHTPAKRALNRARSAKKPAIKVTNVNINAPGKRMSSATRKSIKSTVRKAVKSRR